MYDECPKFDKDLVDGTEQEMDEEAGKDDADIEFEQGIEEAENEHTDQEEEAVGEENSENEADKADEEHTDQEDEKEADNVDGIDSEKEAEKEDDEYTDQEKNRLMLEKLQMMENSRMSKIRREKVTKTDEQRWEQ